jgi:hypothetical protein
MKTNRSIPFYIILLLLINGCSYQINSSIQKSESLITQTNKLNAVFYLQPQVSIFRIEGYNKEDYSLVISSENEMRKTINKLTNKFKIRNELQSLNSINDSISSLNNLSQRIINANEIQQNLFNQISRKDESKLVQQLFTIEPNIGYHYSFLAPVIKSELVGLVGVIAIDLKSRNKESTNNIAYIKYLPENGYVQYHYIVNIVTGKIIYRDIRVFDAAIKPEHLMLTLYDTFYLLNKNLNP